MGLFNTTKKLSLTLVGLSYLCAAHAADIGTIVSGVINTAIDVIKDTTGGAIKAAEDAITIDGNDCGIPFPQSGKIFVLVQDMECSDADGNFALEFSGHDNHIFLNKHSITAVGSEPDFGILITGDGNYVMGQGTVEAFKMANISIKDASFNHVSGLILNEGERGILLQADGDESVRENYIYHNSIQGTMDNGILVAGSSGGSADANRIHNNRIQDTGQEGISVVGFNGGSADANQIHDNRIHDTGVEGITVISNLGGSADANQIISNHIIRPESFAIMLTDATNDNLIDNNFTKEPGGLTVYCDDAGDGANVWGTNFIDMVPIVDFPGFC